VLLLVTGDVPCPNLAAGDWSPHNPSDVLPATATVGDPLVSVRNVYFEAVPLALLSGVVTEHGLLSTEDVRAQITECRRRHWQAFGIAGGEVAPESALTAV